MKKYNKIVSTFKETITKLENLKKNCVLADEKMISKIDVLEQQRREAVTEGDMAQTTADKLKAIFG